MTMHTDTPHSPTATESESAASTQAPAATRAPAAGATPAAASSAPTSEPTVEAVEERAAALEGRILDRRKLAEDVRRLSQVRLAPVVRATAVQWGVIALAMAGAIWSGHWLAYVLAIVVIATRQHALAVLMHEGAHYRLTKHRTLNDTLSDLLFAFPIGISTNLYRKRHFAHHRFTNTDQDPDWKDMHDDEDWHWPKLQWECVKVFARDLLGLNAVRTAMLLRKWSPWPELARPRGSRLTASERGLLLAMLATLLAVLWLTGGWLNFLLLWIVPSLTVLGAIFRLRAIAEHLGVENEHELNETRHVDPSHLERWLICPCHINYHLAHHLFPSVPFYNLPAMHQRLMQEPAFAENAHITTSYLGLFRGVLGELLLRRGHHTQPLSHPPHADRQATQALPTTEAGPQRAA